MQLLQLHVVPSIQRLPKLYKMEVRVAAQPLTLPLCLGQGLDASIRDLHTYNLTG